MGMHMLHHGKKSELYPHSNIVSEFASASLRPRLLTSCRTCLSVFLVIFFFKCLTTFRPRSFLANSCRQFKMG